MAARLLINYRLTNDATAPDLLTGFPYLDGQEIIDEGYGDAGVIEIDLADRTDTTVAQEQWLDTNTRIIGYSIEASDLHETER